MFVTHEVNVFNELTNNMKYINDYCDVVPSNELNLIGSGSIIIMSYHNMQILQGTPNIQSV